MLSVAEKRLARFVAACVHKGDFLAAANLLAGCLSLKKPANDSHEAAIPILQQYLKVLLNGGGMAEAAQILWTPTKFDPTPEFSKQVWKLFDESQLGLIMGAASTSKTYSLGVRLFLEWLRDPEYTTVKVLGPSEDHLEQHLFSQLVDLHANAKLPMPGEVGALYIGLDRRNQLSAIRGVVVPVGKAKRACRLQGTKRKPRATPHPVFGALSRLFVFLDEIENIPSGIWSDLDNLMSNIQDKDDLVGIKIFGAYNPTHPGGEVYQRAEPPFGWADFDADKHFRWTSTRGWNVLRLDGEKSENVVAGKIIFPGLQTAAGLKSIERSAGGRNSPGYQSMGRGAYPLRGQEMTIIPTGMLLSARGELVWYEAPVPVGSCDLALEGGSAAVFSLGKWGQATSVRFPPSLEFPAGRVMMFRNESGGNVLRQALQVEQQLILPKGDTVAMSEEIIKTCRRAGIRPEHFCCDRTGHGQGIADLMKHNWGPIQAVNYSQGASKSLMMQEDTRRCDEEYSRLCCELWFAVRRFTEFGYLYFHPQLDVSKLATQVVQRRYRNVGGQRKVESKRDYTGRGFPSPDEADSLALIVHAVRLGFGVIPSMIGETDSVGAGGDDDWGGPPLFRVDTTNTTQVLETEMDGAEAAWDSTF